MLCQSYFTDIRGAVYFPSRAYNAYQTWHDFDAQETDRDFGYAEDAGLNALRIFVSFEYWLEVGEEAFHRLDKMIVLSQKHGIRIMPVWFEDCGSDNTEAERVNRHPHTATCVCSPCLAIQQNPERWNEVDAFIDAFMRRYGNDERLLAIELMNEPHMNRGNVPFAQYVIRKAKACKGTLPLTIGCMTLWHNLYFGDELDILQYHVNFPPSAEALRQQMSDAKTVQEMTGKPCWLTEWQRVREKSEGWGEKVIPKDDLPPDLASLAAVVRESGMGAFFWSLMVKPAYLLGHRPNGTYNGLFHEDGSVHSLADYQTIAGADKTRPEKHGMPDWYVQKLKEYEV